MKISQKLSALGTERFFGFVSSPPPFEPSPGAAVELARVERYEKTEDEGTVLMRGLRQVFRAECDLQSILVDNVQRKVWWWSESRLANDPK